MTPEQIAEGKRLYAVMESHRYCAGGIRCEGCSFCDASRELSEFMLANALSILSAAERCGELEAFLSRARNFVESPTSFIPGERGEEEDG